MSSSPVAPAAKEVLFLLKGYPRLSETFIAQEIRALEDRGLPIRIVALRRPTDRKTHPVVAEIRAHVSYLPEYLWREPWRVLSGWRRARRLPGYGAARRVWLADLRRDPTPNRGRRFGQALVLAAELPPSVGQFHAHFLHTPASVARYAAMMTGRPWSASAHAKDIWTTSDWEKKEKIASCRWLATCTASGAAALSRLAAEPAKVILARHGLDLARFPAPEGPRPPRDGSDPSDPVVILSVGRTVEKKGYDDLLAALALLPRDLAWRLVHVGGGPLLKSLRRQAQSLGLEAHVDWKGPQAQAAVLAELQIRQSLRARQPHRPGRRQGRPAQRAGRSGQPGPGPSRHPRRRDRGADRRRRDGAPGPAPGSGGNGSSPRPARPRSGPASAPRRRGTSARPARLRHGRGDRAARRRVRSGSPERADRSADSLMRLAFYAPMKPPGHPVPSGDRRMARLLIQAWGRGRP